MKIFLNQLLCGFRKAHSTFNELGFVGTILMDLSKAYDFLPHDLMIAKLEAYGLDKESLHLINDYLTYRKQRTKIGSAYSDGSMSFGKGSGPMLFKALYWDLYFSITVLMKYFLSLKRQTFVILQIITLCIPAKYLYSWQQTSLTSE